MKLRAFRGSLGTALVAVTRALVLVAVSARWHALALLAAYPAVLHAPIQHPRFLTPFPAFLPAIPYSPYTFPQISIPFI